MSCRSKLCLEEMEILGLQKKNLEKPLQHSAIMAGQPTPPLTYPPSKIAGSKSFLPALLRETNG